MTKKEQILIGFLKTKLNIPKDVKYEFVDFDDFGNKRALKVYTDVAKTDKNSGQYDEEYTKFFRPSTKKLTGIPRFTYDWSKKFEGAFTEFFNVTGLPKEYYKVYDEFINYDYLSDINDKIEDAIKRTNYPNTEFNWDRDNNPELRIVFTNLTKEQFDDWRDFKNELQDELRGSVDLDEYNLSFRQPK
jgi:hypothetical protein